MLGHDEHELDVDFEIIEDPEDSAFPRLPNVVSHRSKSYRIIGTVHDLPHPDRLTEITLSATVNVLHYELISEKGHIARPFELWGTSEVTVTFTPDEYSGFPFNIEAVVPRNGDDDHLGQGPDYEALVVITTSSREPLTEEDDGEAEPRHAEEPDDDDIPKKGPKAGGAFIIRFTAK